MNRQTATKSARSASIAVAIVCCGVGALAQSAGTKAVTGPEVYKTIHLTTVYQPNDANDVQMALRDMLPGAKIFYDQADSAFSIRASADDVALAEKIISDLDRTRKLYRLTYTITERDGTKILGVQHFSIVVASGSKTDFKQGSRVPVSTLGGRSSAPEANGVVYLDVGQEIEASLDGDLDGVRLRTKFVQSGVSEEKSVVGLQDPVIRQSTLEGTAILVQGKPLVLGSFDVPGSTRHQEVEVTSELVR